MAAQNSGQKEVTDYLAGLSKFNVNPLWTVMQAAVRGGFSLSKYLVLTVFRYLRIHSLKQSLMFGSTIKFAHSFWKRAA
jgi:hypothetical protein